MTRLSESDATSQKRIDMRVGSHSLLSSYTIHQIDRTHFSIRAHKYAIICCEKFKFRV